MAQFVLGENDILQQLQPGDVSDMEDVPDLKDEDKRHYKKDSRYLEDLYTLTYDEDSSIDQDNYEDPAEEAVMKKIPTGLTSLQVPKKTQQSKFSSGLLRSQSSGPMSLNMLSSKPAVMDHTAAAVAVTADPQLKFASSTLDTNLHKILARRLAGGQPVSYDSCKLLTKAYYKLLRDPAITGVTSTVQPQKLYTHNCSDNSILNWQSLVKTDTQQLKNIVAGYSGLVRSLNDQLMQELMTKDELLAEQDRMLDNISEMTDNLLWSVQTCDQMHLAGFQIET